MSAPTHRLWEVKFGTWDAEVTKDGKPCHKGNPVSWTPAEVTAGEMNVVAADGSTRTLTWAEAALNPGWCKLDWVVADPVRGQLANASNVLDPTWEDADGEEGEAERHQELPGRQEELVEGELRARQVVALLGLAGGREERRRILGGARGRRPQQLLVLGDLQVPGDRVAEADAEDEEPGHDEAAPQQRLQGERGRRGRHRAPIFRGRWGVVKAVVC